MDEIENNKLIAEMSKALSSNQHTFMQMLDKAIIRNGADTAQKCIHDNYCDIIRWLTVCKDMQLTEPRTFRDFY